MIRIDDGVLVEGSMGREGVKLLWELMRVIGFRFTILAEAPSEEAGFNYADKSKVIERNGARIALFNCADENDFKIVLEILSDWCVNDFYITVNSYFDNVLNKVDSSFMFSEYDFLIDDYLKDFPRTIHIEEDKFFIDFKLFKEYVYQLQHVAKRYMK